MNIENKMDVVQAKQTQENGILYNCQLLLRLNEYIFIYIFNVTVRPALLDGVEHLNFGWVTKK